MSKLITKLSAGAFALLMALPVHAQDTLDADSVVATVNGTEVTLGHMLMVRASLPEQYQQLPDDVLWDGILDQIVQQSLLSQQAADEDDNRIVLALENERRALRAAQVIEGVVDAAVTDETVQNFYDEAYLQGEPTEEFNASHILVATEEEAAAIIEDLNGGADFAAVAAEKSTGPSGPNGGSLGWFGPGMMVPEFQTAVEEMEVGAISKPVQTQFGWHVIKLNEKRNQEAPTLDSVRAEIESQLSQQAVTRHLEELTDAAEVTRTAKEEIDTSVLSNLNLLED